MGNVSRVSANHNILPALSIVPVLLACFMQRAPPTPFTLVVASLLLSMIMLLGRHTYIDYNIYPLEEHYTNPNPYRRCITHFLRHGGDTDHTNRAATCVQDTILVRGAGGSFSGQCDMDRIHDMAVGELHCTAVPRSLSVLRIRSTMSPSQTNLRPGTGG